MNTIRRNPFAELENLVNEAFRANTNGQNSNHQANVHRFPLNIHENDDSYLIEVEAPGFGPDDIRVVLESEYLVIEAESKAEAAEGTRLLLRERRTGYFQRRINLTQPIDRDNVVAEYENGVLTLTLPKAEATKARVISVRSASQN
ncbi:MAG: Hsp20/alpha crystallin family protein [Anaerolineales bacterium]|nr:Hsp20/alpha crystallin family protein [Anaerolineales bacterium]